MDKPIHIPLDLPDVRVLEVSRTEQQLSWHEQRSPNTKPYEKWLLLRGTEY